MSIIFITQKNQKFGIGHYVRSNLVKSHLNIKSYFILNNELLYKKKKYNLEKIKKLKIEKIFNEIKVKIIYLDIHILDKLHKKIINLAKSKNIKVIFYDYYDPIVKAANKAFFTPSFYTLKTSFYPKTNFVGWKYILLNKSKKNYIKKKKFDFLISFGGSDPNKITEFVLKFFLKSKLNLKICCIIGNLNQRKKEIKEICNKSEGMIKFFENQKKIDKFINESRFAIISVGLTSYEVIFYNIPSLFIPIKKIDINLAKYFEKKKLGIATPYFKDLNYLILKKKIENLLTKKKTFFNKKKIIDGRGLERVINILQKNHENS